MGIYSVVKDEGLPFAKEHRHTISYPENPETDSQTALDTLINVSQK